MSKAIYEEVIDEIGTQSLARLGLNIFSFNTYEAYGASVTTTNNVMYQHNRKKGMLTPERKEGDTDEDYDNKLKNGKAKYGGYMFESLEVGVQNIMNSFNDNGCKTYTTDTMYDIKNAAKQIQNGKNPENMNEKDREKFYYIMQNYGDEVNSILNGYDFGSGVIKNDPVSDIKTYDKNGNTISSQQLKNIGDTKNLLQDKYLQSDVELKVPRGELERHRKNLEEMINDPKTSSETKEKAQKALEKLNESNFINKWMCENPRITSVGIQGAVSAAHMTSAGLSDGVVVALSTLANGTIYEIKDMFSDEGEKISISQRLERLIKKVIEAFKGTFARGAGFGGVDVIVGILSQIFKSISDKIRKIWKDLRKSAKSIYNAICDFVTGKIKTYQDLVKSIVKALFSFTAIISSMGLETQIKVALSPILLPEIASIVATVLIIIIGAFAVVLGTRAIDSAINYIFGLYADLAKSKAKRVEISKVIDEFLPQLIEDNEKLENLIKTKFKDMKLRLDSSFADLQNAITNSNSELFINSLVYINEVYSKKLKYANFSEFDEAMLSDEKLNLR